MVEGLSDDEALGVLFSKIYDKDSGYVYIMHGDITAHTGVARNPRKIDCKWKMYG